MVRKKEEQAELLRILASLAPGTPVRAALDSILGARTGALIVMGFSPRVQAIMEGGFQLDVDLTPARLYELAKMDGAIILSSDYQKILYANTQLNPDATVMSLETGIRHRVAERVARQTGEIVISVSQRRNVITVFYGSQRYSLKDTVVISNKGNQALQTLEKYNQTLRDILVSLTMLEMDNYVSFKDVFMVLRRVEMVMRVTQLIERYIIELGTEGRLLEMQLDELKSDVADEAALLLRDYCATQGMDTAQMLDALQNDETDHLLDDQQMAKLLGYPYAEIAELAATPRGYRAMDKIPRLPQFIANNVVDSFGTLQAILHADEKALDAVAGVGEARARAIRFGLQSLRKQIYFERQL